MTRESRILHRAHKQCGTCVLIRTPRFLLFVLWIFPKCHVEPLPVLWEENRLKEGHPELLITAMLLKSRIKVVRAGERIRTGQDHLHRKDFTAKFSSAWKLKEQWMEGTAAQAGLHIKNRLAPQINDWPSHLETKLPGVGYSPLVTSRSL